MTAKQKKKEGRDKYIDGLKGTKKFAIIIFYGIIDNFFKCMAILLLFGLVVSGYKINSCSGKPIFEKERLNIKAEKAGEVDK